MIMMVTAAIITALFDIPPTPQFLVKLELGNEKGVGLVVMRTKGSSSHNLISRNPVSLVTVP